MTPSTGKDTLRDYFYSIKNLDLQLEIDRDSKLY